MSKSNPLAALLVLLALSYAASAGSSREVTDLERHERLDFEAFNKQDWKLFRSLHAQWVVVYFPDGRRTRGLDNHLKETMAMFHGTPDSHITTHTVTFAGGDWTAAAGILEATFSEPLRRPDGTVVPPSGRMVRLPIATLARWENGRIVEKRLFWDNAEYLRQLGLAEKISIRGPSRFMRIRTAPAR